VDNPSPQIGDSLDTIIQNITAGYIQKNIEEKTFCVHHQAWAALFSFIYTMAITLALFNNQIDWLHNPALGAHNSLRDVTAHSI
jgi:hypothetical protein